MAQIGKLPKGDENRLLYVGARHVIMFMTMWASVLITIENILTIQVTVSYCYSVEVLVVVTSNVGESFGHKRSVVYFGVILTGNI